MCGVLYIQLPHKNYTEATPRTFCSSMRVFLRQTQKHALLAESFAVSDGFAIFHSTHVKPHSCFACASTKQTIHASSYDLCKIIV